MTLEEISIPKEQAEFYKAFVKLNGKLVVLEGRKTKPTDRDFFLIAGEVDYNPEKSNGIVDIYSGSRPRFDKVFPFTFNEFNDFKGKVYVHKR